jgi:hypothetical protein
MLLKYLRYMYGEIALFEIIANPDYFLVKRAPLVCSSVSMSQFGLNVLLMHILCLDVFFLHLGQRPNIIVNV